MIKRDYFILVFFCVNLCLAQKEKDTTQLKSNPILYADFLIGGSSGEAEGLTFGFDINYQLKKDLITFRSTYVNEKNRESGIAAILIIPAFIGGDSMNEFALLYGKRFIFNSSAISVSAGVSTNVLKYTAYKNNIAYKYRKSYIAIPFEINFNLFKGEKRPYRILYGLIPIGKPTSFGKSFGIKFFGSFGEYNYYGLGLNLGFGWHKKY